MRLVEGLDGERLARVLDEMDADDAADLLGEFPATRQAELLGAMDPEEAELIRTIEQTRPKTRADCVNGPRPCLFVSCKHNLYLDVNPETGSIKLNFPDKEIWELQYTCALDVAEKGGITLEEVGEIMNLTRERIRQVETRGLLKLRDATERDPVPPAKTGTP